VTEWLTLAVCFIRLYDGWLVLRVCVYGGRKNILNNKTLICIHVLIAAGHTVSSSRRRRTVEQFGGATAVMESSGGGAAGGRR
jgi:hypothetical protein